MPVGTFGCAYAYAFGGGVSSIFGWEVGCPPVGLRGKGGGGISWTLLSVPIGTIQVGEPKSPPRVVG